MCRGYTVITHAKLSPSKSPRWRKCPGSVREESKYPDERSTAAIDGTHTHTLLSEVLVMAFMPAHAWVGVELEDHDGKFVVDADRAERVQFAVDFIHSRGGRVFSERNVDPAPLLGIANMNGTADITVIHEDSIEVWDYKDGVSAIDPGSPQLEQYGFGVISEMPTSDRINYKFITLGIIQPKLRDKGMSGVEMITKSMDDFMGGAASLIADAKATQAPDAPLVSGDHCHWCKHKGACSALGNKVMEVVQFTDLTKPVSGTMLDEQIAKIIQNKTLIMELIEGAEKEAYRRFEAGQPIEGLKAVRGRGSRDWLVDESTLVSTLKKCGVPADACYERKLISPAKMEKLTWVKRDGSEQKLSDKHRVMLQSEYIKKSDGKLIIVPAADNRPAVELSAASLFGAVNADFSDPLIPVKE